jgi:hypothetical protein
MLLFAKFCDIIFNVYGLYKRAPITLVINDEITS